MDFPSNKKFIVVLLGASGSGKTFYGSEQNKRFTEPLFTFVTKHEDLARCNVMYFSISKELRNQNMVLILDSAKDLEDAEFIDFEAMKNDLEVRYAILFDVSYETIEKNWATRNDDRDDFRGPAQIYLRSWYVKANDILNYYKRSQRLLSVNDYIIQRSWFLYNQLNTLSPKPDCPNNLHAALIHSSKLKDIFYNLNNVLQVHQFQFTQPVSFVNNSRDLAWVTKLGQYYVTPKTNGVRCLMLKIACGCYMITRKNEIYPCSIVNSQLPLNTVLDGTLLPSEKISDIYSKKSLPLKENVFLAFDILAKSDEVLWKWPFSVRQDNLIQLPLSDDIDIVMFDAQNFGETSHILSLKSEVMSVHCAIKRHYLSTPREILNCLETLSNLPYLSDGMIFTPDTPYMFGFDFMLFKWQFEESIHCDILLNDLKNGKRECTVEFSENVKNGDL
ncbi:uncharacterized protein LOC124439938 isoform X2 [Xenia sp. Carnegie-2017]|uniref:uncharacterized protein LOC124439938 isoform X2 n=1 Tax=Xenia sp. Carnegie-2017 TaxID=2897299 RepID=UPI001F04E2AA|nr:uncharacterized protein LOC124439938 isoform X2 [Xenia sp. Carnegie-2017]